MTAPPPTVRAAETTLRVLQTIAFAESAMGVTHVAGAVGIAKSAAHKHLQTLMEQGMVIQEPATSHYRLGPKLWLMGQRAPQGQMLTEIALPLMQSARDEVGLAVVLSVPTANAAFVLATVNSNQPIDIGVRPGSDLSLHSSAQGKIILAFGKPQLLEQIRSPLPTVTPKTITSITALRAEIAEVKSQRFALAPEQSLLGINALAAPILDRRQNLVGTIGFIGSIQHLAAVPTKHQLSTLLELTATIARRIEGV